MGKFGARDVDIVAVVLVRRRVLQSPVGGGGGGGGLTTITWRQRLHSMYLREARVFGDNAAGWCAPLCLILSPVTPASEMATGMTAQ